MKALTWQGNQNVEVIDVPDPRIQEPTDAIIRVTSTAICGSDLHLYGVLGPYLKPGDVLGHEAMGIVEEVGSDDHQPAGPATGWSCRSTSPAGTAGCARAGCTPSARRPRSGREGKGAALFGYTSLYGSVPGGQAEYLRVPQAQFGPIKVPRRAPRTSSSCSCPTSCPPPGRRSPTPTSQPRAARWPCSASGRSASSRCGSPSTSARRGSSASTRCPSGWPWPRRSGSRRSTSAPVDDVAEHADRAGRRPRPGRGDRRGRHGGARQPAGRAGPEGDRPAARRGRPEDHRQVAARPAGRAARRDQGRPPRRHRVGQRRLRRRGRPDADDGDVRPRHPAADGPGPRPPLERRDAAAGRWIGRPARHPGPGHPPPAAGARRRRRTRCSATRSDGCIKVVLQP